MWTLLMQYRETKSETIHLDEQNLVIGLQASGISPIFAETDGSKIRVYFDRDEAWEKYQLLQRALAGVLSEPLLVDFCKEVQAQQGWRNLLSMMRNSRSDKTKYIQ